MKKISILLLVFLTAIGAFAQEKTIDKSAFDKVYSSSFRWFANQPRRETEISETNGEFVQPTNLLPVAPSNFVPTGKTSSKRITEFLPNVGYHSIYEFNSGRSNKKQERIRIGDKLYTREDDGQWSESVSQISAPPQSTTKILDQQIEYKFLGGESFNNQNTDVYAAIEKSRTIFSDKNVEISSVRTMKYWITKDGNLLKTESKIESRTDKTFSKFTTTHLYEIDPNIKIEAPNLPAAK